MQWSSCTPVHGKLWENGPGRSFGSIDLCWSVRGLAWLVCDLLCGLLVEWLPVMAGGCLRILKLDLSYEHLAPGWRAFFLGLCSRDSGGEMSGGFMDLVLMALGTLVWEANIYGSQRCNCQPTRAEVLGQQTHLLAEGFIGFCPRRLSNSFQEAFHSHFIQGTFTIFRPCLKPQETRKWLLDSRSKPADSV